MSSGGYSHSVVGADDALQNEPTVAYDHRNRKDRKNKKRNQPLGLGFNQIRAIPCRDHTE